MSPERARVLAMAICEDYWAKRDAYYSYYYAVAGSYPDNPRREPALSEIIAKHLEKLEEGKP